MWPNCCGRLTGALKMNNVRDLGSQFMHWISWLAGNLPAAAAAAAARGIVESLLDQTLDWLASGPFQSYKSKQSNSSCAIQLASLPLPQIKQNGRDNNKQRGGGSTELGRCEICVACFWARTLLDLKRILPLTCAVSQGCPVRPSVPCGCPYALMFKLSPAKLIPLAVWSGCLLPYPLPSPLAATARNKLQMKRAAIKLCGFICAAFVFCAK